MQCGSCVHHEPLLTISLQEVAPEPSAALRSGQESTRPINSSPRGLSGQSSPRNKLLCAMLVRRKLPHHQLQTQTHAHLRLSYGAPVCRVKADSCGPLVRRSKYLRVPPIYLACYTAEAQRISPTYSSLIGTYTHDLAKDRPKGSSDGRPDNG